MKRFTDTTIWEKEWFMDLSPAEKIAWFYIKDKCDNVGVWSPNFKLAKVLIGEEIDWMMFIKKVNGNIKIFDNGKWFMIGFCDFQYGQLTESCKPHKSYIELLKKHGLIKGYGKGMGTLQEKEKEKELEKEKEKEKEKRKKIGDIVSLDIDKYETLCYQYGKKAVDSKIDDINNYCLSKGKRYKDYAATVRAWMKKDGVLPKTGDVKRCDKGHAYTGDICEQCI